jgi:hypothetical protein
VIGAWLAGTTTAAAQAGTAALSGTIKDEQGGALPGVTVTATNTAGLVRSTATDETGNVSPARPAAWLLRRARRAVRFPHGVREKLPLPVDVTTRFDVQMAIGTLTRRSASTERSTPSTSPTPASATSFQGAGRALPLEANNINGLLSLQPGAVYVPNAQSATAGPARSSTSTRAAAPSAALAPTSPTSRWTASTSTTRIRDRIRQRAAHDAGFPQEFRVSTSNYGAEAGRSSGPQVSLVTRSGTNDFHGSGNWVQRDTRFSSKLLFPELSQLEQGEASKAPKLDKKIFGGSFGGPSPRTSCSSSATTSGSTKTARRRRCAMSHR